MMAFIGVSLSIITVVAVFAVRHALKTHKEGGTTAAHVHPTHQEIPMTMRSMAPAQNGATHQTTCMIIPANRMPPSSPVVPSRPQATNSNQVPAYDHYLSI